MACIYDDAGLHCLAVELMWQFTERKNNIHMQPTDAARYRIHRHSSPPGTHQLDVPALPEYVAVYPGRSARRSWRPSR